MDNRFLDEKLTDSAGVTGSVAGNHLVVNLIVLNRPMRYEQFKSLYLRCNGVFVCADGGANRLYDSAKKDAESRTQVVPQFIICDMDSIRPDVMEYY